MNKIFIVAGREFFTRIQSRTFIVMSILGPLLFGLFVLVPVLMAKWNNDSTTVWVHDPSGQLSDAFQDQNGLKFQVLPQGTLSNGVLVQADSAKIRQLLEDQDAGLLHLQAPDSNLNVEARYYSAQAAGLKITERIQSALNDRLYRLRMERQGLDPKVIESLRAEVELQTSVWTDQGSEDSHTETAMLLGFGAALLMYMFIFMYGSMVMRGVIEEKASRVMELLVSTTKPFELMMGKILGIASVGLFQFVLWLLLGTAISTAIGAMGLGTAPGTASVASTTTGTAPVPGTAPVSGTSTVPGNPNSIPADAQADWMQILGQMPWETIIPFFLFYFLGGYFFYAALFAAVGSAVDSEGDSQQLMLPISLPIILSFVASQFVMQNPHGSLAFWMSMIPLTSPVVMVVRLPFGVPGWELALSMFLLVAAFVVAVWLAGRIFRIGVLMYGQKVSFNLLRKWLFYR
ncbi:MAG: ABC transporter permease [Bacteroidia bacterium]